MNKLRTILITVAAAATISLTAAMPAFAQGRECLTDRQIQSSIETGKIQSWPKIKRLAGISDYDEVSDVQVCMIQGVPYYMLNVVSPGGEASKIALNALDGTQELL